MGSLPGADRKWQFWIDRGGTFTDIVAIAPDGRQLTHKLLSDSPDTYQDAALQGIREILGLDNQAPIPHNRIESIMLGTTVATNALLEHKGEPTVLAITQGFGDALRIAYQNRPDLFALNIVKPKPLYEKVIEVQERYSAAGKELQPVDVVKTLLDLEAAYREGYRSVAIVLLHGYRYPNHEKYVARLARNAGFPHIAVSHQISPLIKLIGRGDTTVADAYLSPKLGRYIQKLTCEIDEEKLLFMRSNGGLTRAKFFRGTESLLSGPAAGIVGAVRTSQLAGCEKLISFDMGGTSTDVAHFSGEFERTSETEIGGVRITSPMLSIHTVAAGGGSILRFVQGRYQVGPESAGADPGPACYRKNGPLTVTDANLMLGKLIPDFFPKVFGEDGNEPLDIDIVQCKFEILAQEISQLTDDRRTPLEVADGFIKIAVQNMANAIKKISIQRGLDIKHYALCCFGGAGGQHACQVADVLNIEKVLIHPHAGVLSAYGLGLADVRVIREYAVESNFEEAIVKRLELLLDGLEKSAGEEMANQPVDTAEVTVIRKVSLASQGSDTAHAVKFGKYEEMKQRFEALHRNYYGFVMPEKSFVVKKVSVELVGTTSYEKETTFLHTSRKGQLKPLAKIPLFSQGKQHESKVYHRESMIPGDYISGPALIIEKHGTNVIEPGWAAKLHEKGHLILNRITPRQSERFDKSIVDPMLLEIFNNRFVSIAEQMGETLRNTAYSVNIKERLDFSCAMFDGEGFLVANAPHIPVHLGSMSESVQAILSKHKGRMQPGDVFLLNDPYNGGTHLPDLTVVTPVFSEEGTEILFFVASRGHHADIGGLTPSSMPPLSHTIDDEGILITDFKIVEKGTFRRAELLQILDSGRYPARNPQQNEADLRAQVAANEKGIQELYRMVTHFGLPVVKAYMKHVQDNAADAVKEVLGVLKPGQFDYIMDDGSHIKVRIGIDATNRTATIDFTGTATQRSDNFNAPKAITRAAVLYVFRTLVGRQIPLNEGCLKPIEIIIPDGCFLNPKAPAAVAAGNVETAQAIVGALYGALQTMASAQGTMNNFCFGNAFYQYYETLCGGAGAGPDFDGADAVHTHMTNTRLTDPEVLEWRFPVLLESFRIRRNSGGSGKHKGGNGVVRKLRFLEAMSASIISSHRKIAPYGLEGGKSGQLGRNCVVRQTGKIEELGGVALVELEAGDVFVIETPGGGGMGEEEGSING